MDDGISSAAQRRHAKEQLKDDIFPTFLAALLDHMCVARGKDGRDRLLLHLTHFQAKQLEVRTRGQLGAEEIGVTHDIQLRSRAARLEHEERMREATERALMNEEEWVDARAHWDGVVRRGVWTTIRVFISSTFNDMHGERDSFTRHVFPALNKKLVSRRVKAVPLDLRWGLTAEDTSDSGLGALEHCLLAIDQCRPFFVLLTGERYGWRPPGYRVRDIPRWDWVRNFEPGHSITAMEIFHGFMRKRYMPMHAFLYERDPAFMDEITDENEARIFAFDGDAPHVLEKRDSLKAAIHEHPYCKSRKYQCRYGGRDQEGKPFVTGLAGLEEMVLNDLYDAICREFPPPPPPPSPLAMERSLHTFVVEDKASHFLCREEQVAAVDKWVNSFASEPDMPMAIVGGVGSGKTSLVSMVAMPYMHNPKWLVICHMVGASATSSDIHESLWRLCEEIEDVTGIDFNKGDSSFNAVRTEFGRMIGKMENNLLALGRRLLFIIDGADEFTPMNNAPSLDWLPLFMPPRVKLLITMTPDSKCLTSISHREPTPPVFVLDGMKPAEQKELVSFHLNVFGKHLTDTQMNLLLSKTDAPSPLYLTVACEELRLQAQYGMGGSGVDTKIQEMADEVPGMLDVVLARIERDYQAWLESVGMTDSGKEVVKGLLTLLLYSRGGLKQEDLQQLLAQPGQTMMSHTAWNRLYHAVEGYVQPIGDFGMYSLAHRTMKEAVVARYFSDDPDGPTRTYNRLTSFLRKQIDPERDGVWTASGHSAYDDLVYYLVSVLDLPGLHDTLLDVRFVWSRALEGHASLESLLLDYQHARHRLASAKYSEVKAYLQHEGTTREDELLALGEFREFVAANSSEMAQAPYLSFQTALNQPDGSAPFVSAMKWLEEHEGAHAQRRSNKVSSERLLQEPVIPDNWIQWVNKPARRRLLSRFEHKTVVMCVASQPNVEGRLALGFGDSSIEIVDGPTHKVEHNYGTGPHSDGITAIAFSVDGQRLASGCESGTVMVWNTSVGTAIASASGHTERIAGMAWLEKMPQRTLVSIGNDSAVKIWFEKKNDTGASIECVWKDDWLKSMPLAVATNPATHQVVIAHTQGRVSVWDASAPQLEVIHQGAVLAHTGKCTAVHVSHGGQFMVTGGVTGDVKVWGPDEEATGGWKDLCLELTRSHTAAITCACFASSSFDFVTASRDGSTIVWNAASLAPKLCLRQDDVVLCAAFLGDSIVVTCSEDRSVMLWDCKGEDDIQAKAKLPMSIPRELPTVPKQNNSLEKQSSHFELEAHPTPSKVEDLKVYSSEWVHNGAVRCSAAAKSGLYAATGGDGGEIKILWVRNCREDRVLLGHQAPVTALAFSDDDKLLASGDEHGTVMLWTLPDFAHVHTVYVAENVPISSLALVDHAAASVDLQFFHSRRVTTEGEAGDGDAAEQQAAAVKLQSFARGNAARRRVKDAKSQGLRRRKGTRDDYLEDKHGPHWLLVTGCADGRVNVWNSKTTAAWGLEPQNKHGGKVVSLVFVPDSEPRVPKVRGLPDGYDDVDGEDGDSSEDDGEEAAEVSHSLSPPEEEATATDFTCARIVSVGADGEMITWRIGTMEVLCKEVVGLCGEVSAASFTPDCQTLALASMNRETPLTRCRLFQRQTEPEACKLSLALPPKVVSGNPLFENVKVQPRVVGIETVAASPDGNFLVAGGEDHLVYLVDAKRTNDGPVACFRMDARVTTLTYLPLVKGVNAGATPDTLTGAGGAGAGAALPEQEQVMKRGCIGLIVGGDDRGKVYLLRLFDLGEYLEARAIPSDSSTLVRPIPRVPDSVVGYEFQSGSIVRSAATQGLVIPSDAEDSPDALAALTLWARLNISFSDENTKQEVSPVDAVDMLQLVDIFATYPTVTLNSSDSAEAGAVASSKVGALLGNLQRRLDALKAEAVATQTPLAPPSQVDKAERKDGGESTAADSAALGGKEEAGDDSAGKPDQEDGGKSDVANVETGEGDDDNEADSGDDDENDEDDDDDGGDDDEEEDEDDNDDDDGDDDDGADDDDDDDDDDGGDGDGDGKDDGEVQGNETANSGDASQAVEPSKPSEESQHAGAQGDDAVAADEDESESESSDDESEDENYVEPLSLRSIVRSTTQSCAWWLSLCTNSVDVWQLWKQPTALLVVLTGKGPALCCKPGELDALKDPLADIVTNAIVPAAYANGAAVLDRGAAHPFPRAIAEVAARDSRGLRVVGVVPEDGVLLSGSAQPHRAPLDPNHTDYVVGCDQKWGQELETLVALAAAAQRYVPVVTLVVGGDLTSDRAIKLLGLRGIPVVALKGTGGTADKLALAASDSSARKLVPASIRDLVTNHSMDVDVFDIHGSGGSPALRRMLLRSFYIARQQHTVCLRYFRQHGPPAPSFPAPVRVPSRSASRKVSAVAAITGSGAGPGAGAGSGSPSMGTLAALDSVKAMAGANASRGKLRWCQLSLRVKDDRKRGKGAFFRSKNLIGDIWARARKKASAPKGAVRAKKFWKKY